MLQSLAISLCPFRPTIGAGSFIDTPKSLYNKGVLNIQNLKDDLCFLWCIFAHKHRVDKHAVKTSKYEPFMHELNTTGLQFPLKFSDTPKLENVYQTIIVNVLVYENNEVFSLYASKHRDRKHHENLLMISNNEGKFHYLFVRQGLVRSHLWTHEPSTPCVSLSILSILLLTGAFAYSSPLDCSVYPKQKVEYPSPDDPGKNIKKFKAIAKMLHVLFVLYADF